MRFGVESASYYVLDGETSPYPSFAIMTDRQSLNNALATHTAPEKTKKMIEKAINQRTPKNMQIDLYNFGIRERRLMPEIKTLMSQVISNGDASIIDLSQYDTSNENIKEITRIESRIKGNQFLTFCTEDRQKIMGVTLLTSD